MRLSDAQSALATAILTGNAASSVHVIGVGQEAMLRRLQIHRNHFLTSLSDAMSATFPVTRRLLGEGYFERIARRFVAAHPPSSPCLFEYGAELPDYLRDHPVGHSIPMIADLALLEWSMVRASTAPDAPTLSAEALRQIGRLKIQHVTLSLHPSCQLISSRYPVDRIWRAHHEAPEQEAHETVCDLHVRLLILRDREGDVAWRRIGKNESAFVRALRTGHPLGTAYKAASKPFDRAKIGKFLLQLIDAGAINEARLS